MKRLALILLALTLRVPLLAQPHVPYFPLHIGDSWDYNASSWSMCEGTSIINIIQGDTVIEGHTYLRFFERSLFAGPYVRADSTRVFEYDVVDKREYVVFNFMASPGDTLSRCNHDTLITVAGGPMTFSRGDAIYTIRDSIGVFSVNFPRSLCYMELRNAFINGKHVYPATGIDGTGTPVPVCAYLEQNYPNPFNPSSTIRYALPERSHVSLTVFNALGQQVATLVNEAQEPGYHDVRFDGSGLASGVYFYRLSAGNYENTRQMTLVK